MAFFPHIHIFIRLGGFSSRAFFALGAFRVAITIGTASHWPSRLAYAAAGIFCLASGGTNLIYGWSKGVDIPSSIIWAAVSLGVSIVFALSWPALIASLDRKQWSRATMALVALVLTGAYSTTAALGSAMGGRMNAANQVQAILDARSKAQASYDAANAELSALAPARPVAELQALIDGVMIDPRSIGCATVDGPFTRANCPKVAEWKAEQARAERRQLLMAEMEKAKAELEGLPPPKIANSDTSALQVYLKAIGFEVGADRLNKLLVLLAVLVIECGGGLALAVGISLSPAAWMADVRTDARPTNVGTMTDTFAQRQVADTNTATRLAAQDKLSSPANDRLLSFIRDRGGVVVGGQRTMARALGWSKTRTHEVLHDLASKGLAQLSTRSTGTVVKLAS